MRCCEIAVGAALAPPNFFKVMQIIFPSAL